MLRNPSPELQALFYIDEVAPFIPPVEKPSCKEDLELLFKQARKFGIGCLIATQNPGDVDYKALSQFGTWVIGRRDPQVVLCSAPAPLAARDVLQVTVLLQAGYAARVGSDRGIIFEDGFQSVDKVLHPSRLEFYSTKPPLLTLLAAGEYWALKHVFGLSIFKDRNIVVRIIVWTFNMHRDDPDSTDGGFKC